MINSVVIPILSLVAIFLFSVHKFSDHIQHIAGDKFKSLLHSFTSTPLRGFGLGALFTSLIQSSTATTVILVSLVHAGLLSFRNTLGVIFGSNLGSTITSQLVALNIGNFAPYFILLGFFAAFSKGRFKTFGKPIYYFGLMFFSLAMISVYLAPVRESGEVLSLLSRVSSFPLAVLVGIVFTAIVQSSGVVLGIVILLVGNGLMGFEQAFGMIIGANIGTTVTALIAAIFTNEEAKKVALAHFLFNMIGFILFLPFETEVSGVLEKIGGSASQQVANAHLLFNLSCGVLFLVLVKPFEKVVNGTAKILRISHSQ